MASSNNNQSDGRGWHGDSKGHAEAGKQSSGKFQKGDARTVRAAQAGGSASSGSFEAGSKRAKDAGREGGMKSHGAKESSG